MPYYDNPAGRLHELLRRLAEQDRQESLLKGWAGVLDVDSDDVILHIGAVADLVRQIQEAVDAIGEEVLRAPVSRLRSTWARPIFPPDYEFNQALNPMLVPGEALESLGLVAAQLSLRAPEGKVPGNDELATLKAQVRDLVDAVREAEDLDDEVKHVIVAL